MSGGFRGVDCIYILLGWGSSKIWMMDRNLSRPPPPPPRHLNNDRSLMLPQLTKPYRKAVFRPSDKEYMYLKRIPVPLTKHMFEHQNV